MKKAASIIVMLVLFVVTACTQYQYEGGATGAIIGGTAGAILDHRNPWRGGVIGAALGALAGATIADISVRGAQEAYTTGRPVEYRTEDGRGMYYAEPLGYDSHTRCRRIHEKVWEDGYLVKDRVREICESGKHYRRY